MDVPANQDFEDGSIFNEDTSEPLGVLPDTNIPLPVNISIYTNGHWYVYKLDRMYKQEEVEQHGSEVKEDKYAQL